MLTKDLYKLQKELEQDPLDRGYADMTDQKVVDDLMSKYRTRKINSFSGDFMFSKADPAEFGDLSEHKQVLWNSFCSKASVDPWADNNIEFVKWIFGESSNTVASLDDERTEDISRAEELGYNSISVSKISAVRSE